jgi:thiol-disulfide isomerase/thioredoxin
MRFLRSTILLMLASMSMLHVHAQLTIQITDLDQSRFSFTDAEGTKLQTRRDEQGHIVVDTKNLNKGFYYLAGIGQVYLKPGYKMTVTGTENHFVFEGIGSEENNLIQEIDIPLQRLRANNGYGYWHSVFLTEPAVLIPLLHTYVENAKQQISASSDTYFKEVLKEDVEFVKIVTLSNYRRFYGLDSTKMDSLRKYLAIPLASRTKDYSMRLYKAYQSQFSKKLSVGEIQQLDSIMYHGWDMNNERLFKNSQAYGTAIDNKFTFLIQMPEWKQRRDSLRNDDQLKLSLISENISNEYVRNFYRFHYTLGAIKHTKDLAAGASLYRNFSNTKPISRYQNAIDQVFNNLKGTVPKAIAPEFSYPDPSGKLITLKSMRGNYVYIDLWATWCQPCIAEIPGLKLLEEKYRGRNIKFVSISLDRLSEKNTWLKYVKDQRLLGIQVIADKDFNSNFVKMFSVTSIPRFILIAPDGTVIDNDAKRPSNPELSKQLDGYFRVPI